MLKKVVETVGGEVDILVITPEETKWLQKAELYIYLEMVKYETKRILYNSGQRPNGHV